MPRKLEEKKEEKKEWEFPVAGDSGNRVKGQTMVCHLVNVTVHLFHRPIEGCNLNIDLQT